VYEANQQATPTTFGWAKNVAVAVDGSTDQQLTPDTISRIARFSRLGHSGAWLYLGYGLDTSTLVLVAVLLALYLLATYVRVWLKSQKSAHPNYGAALTVVGLFMRVVTVGLFLVLGLVGLFAAALSFETGDPVATGLLEVFPAMALIGPVIANNVLLPQPQPRLRAIASVVVGASICAAALMALPPQSLVPPAAHAASIAVTIASSGDADVSLSYFPPNTQIYVLLDTTQEGKVETDSIGSARIRISFPYGGHTVSGCLTAAGEKCPAAILKSRTPGTG
jgi:hypothetical protein